MLTTTFMQSLELIKAGIDQSTADYGYLLSNKVRPVPIWDIPEDATLLKRFATRGMQVLRVDFLYMCGPSTASELAYRIGKSHGGITGQIGRGLGIERIVVIRRYIIREVSYLMYECV